jgi:uncharacterized protein YuzE
MKPTRFSFSLRVENDDQTGEILAVYLQIRKGKSQRVKEYANGTAFADYSRNGDLLGIELLAPCEVKVLTRIATDEPAKRFIKNSTPRGMLVTS